MTYPVCSRHLAFTTLPARADDDQDDSERRGCGLTLTGLAVPYRSITRIDNWIEGRFDEEFAEGAFKRSLGMKTPKLQFDHGTHSTVGSIPIGTFRSLTETKLGLEVEAELFDNWMTEPIRDALATEAIDGMSIRFRPVRVVITEADARDDDGEVELRTVVEAELHELGPVVFPAYPESEAELRTQLLRLGIDLDDKSDRHRLGMALLGGGATTGRAGHPSGPGTTPPEAGVPADRSGPTTSHPDQYPPRRLPIRARRARVNELLEI